MQLSLVVHTLVPLLLFIFDIIDIVHAHNGFLQSLSDFGIPVLICLLGVILTIVYNLLRHNNTFYAERWGILAHHFGFAAIRNLMTISIYRQRGDIFVLIVLGFGANSQQQHNYSTRRTS